MPMSQLQLATPAGKRILFRNLITSRSARTALLPLTCFIFIFVFVLVHSTDRKPQRTSSGSDFGKTRGAARFHSLVPATSSNPDLCKLLLSSQILGYPTPVLINYGATEAADPYVQHLAKLQGVLDYLEQQSVATDVAEELVLIVDGYDVWFQLPPDVLLSRYYELIAAADARAEATYGPKVARANNMWHSIVFGPDKICWPIDWKRPACWAVPLGTLADNAFGPETSKGRESHNLPRWLNSGTILGPLEHMKDLLHATLDLIHANHTTDSDQYYLAEIFGAQEHARLQHRPDLLKTYREMRYDDEHDSPEVPVVRHSPELVSQQRTEYHIIIDYESTIFQTFAFWKQYLAWMRPKDSWPPLSQVLQSTWPSQLTVPSDLQASNFTTYLDDVLVSRYGSWPWERWSWENAVLLYNTVTRQIPAVIHFTGDKQFRHFWWRNIWFQSEAERLRQNGLEMLQRENGSLGNINGYTWYNAEPAEADNVYMRGLGGAWSDQVKWLSWGSLCKPFEESMYRLPGQEMFHAALKDTDVQAGA